MVIVVPMASASATASSQSANLRLAVVEHDPDRHRGDGRAGVEARIDEAEDPAAGAAGRTTMSRDGKVIPRPKPAHAVDAVPRR